MITIRRIFRYNRKSTIICTVRGWGNYILEENRKKVFISREAETYCVSVSSSIYLFQNGR